MAFMQVIEEVCDDQNQDCFSALMFFIKGYCKIVLNQ